MDTPRELIAPQTAAVATEVKMKIGDNQVPCTIIASGLAGAETATVRFTVDNGVTYEDLYVDGLAVVLTATNKAVAIYSPMTIGVIKSVTVGAAGVYAAVGGSA